MFTPSIAIGFAVIAMLAWGIGDFMIQKSSRRLGDWETLFVITAFGTIVLIPFVYKDIASVFLAPLDLLVIVTSGVFLTAAAIFEIESFRKGKISVVEPMLPFEIPAAAILAFAILGDKITAIQLIFIIVLIIGLFLVSFRGRVLSLKYFAEKGIFFGLVGAGLMGVADFLLGWGSRLANPILANFILNIVMAISSGIFLLATGKVKKTIKDISANKGLVLIMSISDNIAWIGYAFAMTLIPIAVATGLSEGSVIVAVLLGIFMNKEKLQPHQKVGLIFALASAIILAFITA